MRGEIAEVRRLKEGEPAISPARFPDWDDESQIKDFADQVKEETGGIPIGYKLSAQHIEAALRIGVNYVILDGRCAGTGAAPLIFRDHILVPTIPALARSQKIFGSSGEEGYFPYYYGRFKSPRRFFQGNGSGAGCDCRFQFSNIGYWLFGSASLSYE